MKSIDQLIVHPQTRLELDNYMNAPSHAVMLLGPVGVGLGQLAKSLGNKLSGNEIIIIEPTIHGKQKTAIINADDIASLGQLVRDRRRDNLAIVMLDVDQTASGVFERLLKIIEEPSDNIDYIFASHTKHNIPDTILSRTSVINVQTPLKKDCQPLLDQINDPTKRRQIEFLAGRLPAEASRLISDDSLFESAVKHMELAKRFINGSKGDRLATLAQMSDRTDAIKLLSSLANVLTATNRLGRLSIDHYAKSIAIISQATDRIQASGSPRLQMMEVALALP